MTKPKLWNSGANQAVDMLITRKLGPHMEMVAIRRRSGEWAIPGGFLDPKEEKLDAATRELQEETGITGMDPGRIKQVFEGKVDDPRNQEDRWIETTLFHIHLKASEARDIQPVAGDDAQGAAWMELRPAAIEALYADHPRLIAVAMEAHEA